MFAGLTDRLTGALGRLTGRGALSEDDVAAAMREIRVALLEADVALPVVKDFVERVGARAVGEEVMRSVTPGQQVVKIVNDCLVETLGPGGGDLDVRAPAPAAVMMVGLQGSGKTTTSAKIGKLLQGRRGRRVLMASLDVSRPAAQEQLAVLGGQAGVATLPAVPGQPPREIADRAMDTARREGHDIVVLDTAGRVQVDDGLMAEAAAVRDAVRPAEVLLVADAMTGQEAVGIARAFDERLALTGIVLTRVDGDARGGAALSMRAVTGKPIRLLCTGEGLDAVEGFHPDRIASRILGMGDVVGLVERAQELADDREAQELVRKLGKGGFDLDDMASQLRQLRRMGGLGGVMGMLPGARKARGQMEAADIDDRTLLRQEAIIGSMTPQERRRPEIIKASRKRRIASGAGVGLNDVNKVLKQHKMMSRVMKRAGRAGGGIEALGDQALAAMQQPRQRFKPRFR